MTKRELAGMRRWYAEGLKIRVGVKNDAIIDAFSAVPRERFLGPGPWHVPSIIDGNYTRTPDAHTRWLYHDTLVAIDKKRNLNSGSPSAWAFWLDQLDIKAGERILQVGAGVGYFSALLAELVGVNGKVTAVEYDKKLSAKALKNTKPWKQIEVINGNGVKHDPGEVDIVVAFAGATHPAPLWLNRLSRRGRLFMPLTSDQKTGGFMLKAIRQATAFTANSVSGVWVYDCAGARNRAESQSLGRALKGNSNRAKIPIRSMHLGKPSNPSAKNVWYAGKGFWLSTLPLRNR